MGRIQRFYTLTSYNQKVKKNYMVHSKVNIIDHHNLLYTCCYDGKARNSMTTIQIERIMEGKLPYMYNIPI